MPNGSNFKKKQGVPQGLLFALQLNMCANFMRSLLFAAHGSDTVKNFIYKPDATGHYSYVHYGALSTMAGLAAFSWLNQLYQIKKAPNFNQGHATALATKTTIAGAASSIVFGGFAKKAFMSAGPVGFLAFSGFMTLKLLYGAAQNTWYMNKLSKYKGGKKTKAYQTYRRKRNRYLKQALFQAVAASATAVLVTFSAAVSVPVSIAMAAVSAVVGIGRVVMGYVQRRKLANRQHSRKRLRHVASAKVGTDDVAVTNERRRMVRWRRGARHQLKAIRDFDRRLDYREYLKGKMKGQATNTRRKAVKETMLAILQDAYEVYCEKYSNGSFFEKNKHRLKANLCMKLKDMVINDGITIDRVHELVKQNRGSFYRQGALSSFNKRVGHMQSIVEAVELYAAYRQSAGMYQKDGYREYLRYQNQTDYAVSELPPQSSRQALQQVINNNPEDLRIVKEEMLRQLEKAKRSYKEKTQSGLLLMRNVHHLKRRLCIDLIRGIENNTLTISGLERMKTCYSGSGLQRGALSSFYREEGGMQGLIKAVELYLEFKARKPRLEGYLREYKKEALMTHRYVRL